MRKLLSLFIVSALFCLSYGVELNLLLLFSITRLEGELDIVDPVNTAAYLATAALIEQLNADKETLFDKPTCEYDISYTLINTRSEFTTALAKMTELDLESFDALIGPSRSTTCVPISFATLPFDLPVISHSCTTPELDDANSHQNFVRTIASDETTAKAFVDLIRVLPTGTRTPELPQNSIPELQTYSQVVVLYQDDSYGSKYKDSLFRNRGDIEFIFFAFRAGVKSSIEAAIEAASKTRLNVFIGIFNLESLQMLVTAAISRDLMGPNRLWMFSDGVLGSNEIMNDIGTVTRRPLSQDVLAALDNTFLVQATGRTNKGVEGTFDNQFFDPEFGYQQSIFDELGNAAANVNFDATFEAFRAPGYVTADFALFAYDTILTLVEYFEQVSEECNATFDRTKLVDFVKSDTFSFDGLSGKVEFDRLTGARTEGTSTIKLINMRFDESSADDALVGEFQSSSWNLFSNVAFTGGSEKAPLLVDPPDEVSRIEIEDRIKAGMFGFAATILFTVTLLFGFIYKYRDRNVIKAAQPLFLNIMLFGIVVSTVSVYVLPREGVEVELENGESGPSLECNAPFFLISLGITITFAALAFKLQRVAYVANTTPELRDNKVYSMWDSIKLIILVVAINVSLMIAAYAQNPLILKETVTERDEFGQPLETFDVCEPDSNGNGEIYAILLAFHLIFYFYGFRLISKTRNMSTDFQEGRWIALSVIAQFQLYLLGIPVVIAVGVDAPGIRYMVVSLVVQFSNIILLVLIFAPKIYRVIIGDDDVVWSDRNDVNSGLNHYSTKRDFQDSRKYQSVRQSLYNTMATQEFGNEITL